MTDQPEIAPDPRPSYALAMLRHAAALAAVALATLAGCLVTRIWGDDPVALLYIPVVLGASVWAGFRPALVAAIASALAYNYFFTAPYRTFIIHSPADIVTVVMLFLVAAVTSRLAAGLRGQARIAAAHAARNATIAGFARRLLSSAGDTGIAEVATAEIARLFQCNTVLAVPGSDGPRILASVPPDAPLTPSDAAAAAHALASAGAAGRGIKGVDLADWQFSPVVSGHVAIAAIGLARDDGAVPVAESRTELLASLRDQVALALERARLEAEAREFAGLRERDKLRSALLAAIGEDVKPRLNAIGAATRALKRAGEGDRALIASVADEAVRLDRYIDNLVDLSPGAEQVPLVLGGLTLDLHRRVVSNNGQEVHLTPKEYAVLAELAKHAGRVLTHAHLLKAVWGPAQAEQIDYLRIAIRALRRKLEADPASPALILNEPAVGYRLAAAV